MTDAEADATAMDYRTLKRRLLELEQHCAMLDMLSDLDRRVSRLEVVTGVCGTAQDAVRRFDAVPVDDDTPSEEE